jgi:hypothetical protein
MKSLLEKAERMMATIIEVIEVEPSGTETITTVVEEELSRDSEVSRDAHNKLIELCW